MRKDTQNEEYRLILWRHVRIGYVSCLVLIDCLIAPLGLYDLWMYKRAGLSVKAALELALTTATSDQLLQSFALAILLGLLMPIFLGVVLTLTARTRMRNWLTRQGRAWSVLHIILTAVLSLSPILLDAMQRVAGYRLTNSGNTYDFKSSLNLIANIAGHPVAVLIALALVSVASFPLKALATRLIQSGETPSGAVKYMQLTLLADLGRDYYPPVASDYSYFNAGVSPQITFAARKSARFIEKYQAKLPGSIEAGAFLAAEAETCRQRLKVMLFGDAQEADWSIQFFPSTSRALEVALADFRIVDKIILSPYEHPSEIAVANWYSTLLDCNCIALRFHGGAFGALWDEQEKALVELISPLAGPGCVLVLSEVCYRTGMRIPIDKVQARLRQELGEKTPRIVVDAAHSVGNGEGSTRIPQSCESYILSTGKWLFSPEPGGIRVFKVNPPKGIRAYDAWDQMLPHTTANARMLGGLKAGLDLISTLGAGNLIQRSGVVKREFLSLFQALEDRLHIIGDPRDQRSTAMMAIAPKTGFKWRECGQKLHELLINKERVFVTVVEGAAGDAKEWIRVAFPYYLDARDLRRLRNALESIVVSD
jgi:selenocysteine lyase/cysteine desulfurase